MAETTEDKESCSTCGVDVRENTLFCYNCGNRLTVEDAVTDSEPPLTEEETPQKPEGKVKDEAKAALDDLAERLKFDEDIPKSEKLAKAADERRKARVKKRSSDEYTWEPEPDGPNLCLLLVSLLIGVITIAVVFVMVIWK